MSKWLRSGDRVIVIAGNEKGKSGKLLSSKKHRVRIEGLNMRKKCLRRSEERPEGQIIELEGSIHISNVALCSAKGKPVKLRTRVKEGTKELYYLEDDREVVYREAKGNPS